MDREIGGILGASLAAPYVVVMLLPLIAIGAGLEDHGIILKARFYEDLLLLGTAGLMMSIVPTLILSMLMAGTLHSLKAHSCPGAILGGSLVRLCFGAVFGSSSVMQSWSLMLAFPLSSAICGGIYWQIAIGRTPGSTHAIDAA
jgi:hypothetical protein